MVLLSVLARRHKPNAKTPTLPVPAEDVELLDKECDDIAAVASNVSMPAPAPVPAAGSSAWGLARPLSSSPAALGDDAAVQLGILTKGRALVKSVLERLPALDPLAAKTKGESGVRVLREGGGHLSLTMKPHPDALGEVQWDLHMIDTWHVDIILRGHGLGTGLLPLLSLFREPDLVADYLPRQAGLPYIESLVHEKIFGSVGAAQTLDFLPVHAVCCML